MNEPAKDRSPLVWFALIVVPLLYALIRQAPWQWHYGLAASLHWILASLVIGWAVSRLNGPSDIGLFRPVAIFLGFVATICVAVGTQIALFQNEPLADWQWRSVFGLGRWSIAVTAITAGFCEELIYRGYMMNALKRNGSGPFAAMALSSLSFVFFHGMLPVPMLVAGFIISMIWAFIYHKTGILWVTVFIHGLWDVFVLLTPWAAIFGEQGT